MFVTKCFHRKLNVRKSLDFLHGMVITDNSKCKLARHFKLIGAGLS